MKAWLASLIALTGLIAAIPAGAKECPPEVTAAVLKAHAGATVVACKQEVEDGKTQYEVKITGKDGRRIDCDVSPAGQILLTEEYLELKEVPPAVMTAFAAKYAGAQATAAERQTASDGKITYEIAFGMGDAKKSASFDADGKFLAEEVEGDEGQD